MKNVSGRDLTDLRIICHGFPDGSCFGGGTYIDRIASLSNGGSAAIHTQDRIPGVAQAAPMELGA